jgi:hypothetical protein
VECSTQRQEQGPRTYPRQGWHKLMAGKPKRKPMLIEGGPPVQHRVLDRMNSGGGPMRANAPRRAAPRRTFSERQMVPHSPPVYRYTRAFRLSAACSPHASPSSGSKCPSPPSNTETRRNSFFPSLGRTLCPDPRTPGPCAKTVGPFVPIPGPCFPNTA